MFPAIGYYAPRPVALHLAPLLGGRRARPAALDRLARPAARRDRRRPRTRCRGCRSTPPSCPRSRRPGCRSRRSRTRPTTASTPTTCGTSRARCSPTRSARSAASPVATDPFLTKASADGRPVQPASPAARPLHRRGRPGALPHEGRSTPTATSRTSSPGSRLCSMPASRSGRSRSRRRAATTRTPTRAGRSQQGLQETALALAAFQADLEQRHLGDRVATLLWSEFGRRAEQNDTNGTDHGAAGVGVPARASTSATRWSASSRASAAARASTATGT